MIDQFVRHAVFLLAWTGPMQPAVAARVQARAVAVSWALDAHYPRQSASAGPASFAVWASRVRWRRIDAALLAAIDYYETGFGHRGVPWGACAARIDGRRLCVAHCGQCSERIEDTEDVVFLSSVATWVLHTLAEARRICDPPGAPVTMRRLAVWLSYYHHGSNCAVDAFGTQEALAAWGLLAASP